MCVYERSSLQPTCPTLDSGGLKSGVRPGDQTKQRSRGPFSGETQASLRSVITAQVGGPDLGKPSSHRDVGAMSPGRHHGSSDFLLSLTVKVSRCLEGPSPQEAPYKGAWEERAEWTTCWMQSGSVKASKALRAWLGR